MSSELFIDISEMFMTSLKHSGGVDISYSGQFAIAVRALCAKLRMLGSTGV